MRISVYAGLLLFGSVLPGAEPRHVSRMVFPLEHWHNHSSSLVELPDGDFLVCWYNGSGERKADDVKIEAARLSRRTGEWGQRFTLADTPGFPDTNPILWVDAKSRLWLVWPVILANEWHTALLKFRIASKVPENAMPVWDISDNILLKPDKFEERTRELLAPVIEKEPPGTRRDLLTRLLERSNDKYFHRMGWMPRTHPIALPSGRILLPLYSDGFSFSLIAISDDSGATWSTSQPIIGGGAVQPSIVRRKDGTLIAYMRDNGPPPKRVLVSTSKDDGVQWKPAVDTDIPNSGTSVEVLALRDGLWLMVNNDTETGRHSLAASLSDDEGRTWKWRRNLEFDARGKGASSFHYPSVIQARDGAIHVTYSYFLNHVAEGQPRKSIKHAEFNVEWIKAGNPPASH